MKLSVIKIQGVGFICASDEDAAKLNKIGDGEILEISVDIDDSRTKKQNRCLHSYLGQMAKKLNKAGYDFKQVVKLPVSFTTSNMKEYMFKPVMTKTYPEIKSTTELTTKQMQDVYEGFNAAMADRLGVSGSWPDRFNGGSID